MNNLQNAMILFTEMQDLQSPDLKNKMIRFKQLLTTNDIIHEIVSMGIFSNVPSYLSVLPQETILLIELLIKDRDTTEAFISTSFYDSFLLFLAEQTQPEIISPSLRVISLVTKYSITKPELILPFIVQFILPQYIDSVQILYNFMSHSIPIPQDLTLEPLVGKLLSSKQKSEVIFAVYYNLFTIGEDAMDQIDSLIKMLPTNDKTKAYVIGIFTRLVSLYFSGMCPASLKEKLEKCCNQILTPNICNQISSFASQTREIFLISFILTFFEFLSTDYRGIECIKNSNALHSIIVLMEQTQIPIPTYKYQIIFNVLTNCATDGDLYNVLQHLNIVRYTSEILIKKEIEDRNVIDAAYRVILAFMSKDEYTSFESIIQRNDIENEIWLCIAATSEVPRQGIAKGLLHFLNEKNFYVIVDVIKHYLTSIIKLKPEEINYFEEEKMYCCEILFKSIVKGYLVREVIELFIKYNFLIHDEWVQTLDIDSLFSLLRANSIPQLILIRFCTLLLPTPLHDNVVLLTTIFELVDSTNIENQKEILNFFSRAIETSAIELIDDLGWIDILFQNLNSIQPLQKSLIAFLKSYKSKKEFSEGLKQKILDYLSSLIETENGEECCELITELSS